MSDVARNVPLRDLVYTIPEAMERTGYSRDGLASMIEGGQLETVRLGKREYISKMSVDNLIDAALHGGGRTAAAPEALATVSPETTDPAEAERLLAAMCAAAPATD